MRAADQAHADTGRLARAKIAARTIGRDARCRPRSAKDNPMDVRFLAPMLLRCRVVHGWALSHAAAKPARWRRTADADAHAHCAGPGTDFCGRQPTSAGCRHPDGATGAMEARQPLGCAIRWAFPWKHGPAATPSSTNQPGERRRARNAAAFSSGGMVQAHRMTDWFSTGG